MMTARDCVQLGYLLSNLVSACAIVFANKAVLSVIKFNLTIALTCLHTITTWIVSMLTCKAGSKARSMPKKACFALAAAFSSYIVLCNISLALNTVGFYQLTKIAIAPAVLIIESVSSRQVPELRLTACIIVVCLGITLATVADKEVTTNPAGFATGVVSVVVSAQYGVWIGGMIKHYGITSMDLLHQYVPYASAMLTMCTILESLVFRLAYSEGALTTFTYTSRAIATIGFSAILGVLVTFSTFLVIEHTSPLTYAVVGHVKTLVIIAGGVVLFDEQISGTKMLGIGVALSGVIAYTWINHSQADRIIENKVTVKSDELD